MPKTYPKTTTGRLTVLLLGRRCRQTLRGPGSVWS
jgi:hypothetical protein